MGMDEPLYHFHRSEYIIKAYFLLICQGELFLLLLLLPSAGHLLSLAMK
jgi:hypothetical protein